MKPNPTFKCQDCAASVGLYDEFCVDCIQGVSEVERLKRKLLSVQVSGMLASDRFLQELEFALFAPYTIDRKGASPEEHVINGIHDLKVAYEHLQVHQGMLEKNLEAANELIKQLSSTLMFYEKRERGTSENRAEKALGKIMEYLESCTKRMTKGNAPPSLVRIYQQWKESQR